jgi:DNA-binding MarR family transcriptional regulator
MFYLSQLHHCILKSHCSNSLCARRTGRHTFLRWWNRRPLRRSRSRWSSNRNWPSGLRIAAATQVVPGRQQLAPVGRSTYSTAPRLRSQLLPWNSFSQQHFVPDRKGPGPGQTIGIRRYISCMPKATSSTIVATTVAPTELRQVASSLSVLSRAFTLSRPHEHLLAEAGVRLDRAGSALLLKLRSHGEPARVSDLAELLGVDTPAVTRKVQQLERLGYVAIKGDADDKRAKRIELTKSGEKTIERIMTAVDHRLARLFEGWPPNEVSIFSTSLDKFARALTAEMENDRD